MSINKIWNPFFRRDYEQKGDNVIFKKTGIWVLTWTENKRIGFKTVEVKMERKFKTKIQADKFMYKILAKMWK